MRFEECTLCCAINCSNEQTPKAKLFVSLLSKRLNLLYVAMIHQSLELQVDGWRDGQTGINLQCMVN